MVTGVGGDLSLDLRLDAFDRLIAFHNRRSGKGDSPKFVKRIEDVPKVALPSKETIWVILSLADRALIRQFTGLWPSPKTTDSWIQRNWRPLISKNVASYSIRRVTFFSNSRKTKI